LTVTERKYVPPGPYPVRQRALALDLGRRRNGVLGEQPEVEVDRGERPGQRLLRAPPTLGGGHASKGLTGATRGMHT
jgi:hypothetical protein